jgi:hypothetical protein
LVLRLCGLRSSPSSILAALELKMATLDRQEQEPQDAVPACDWCRMGLHKKCTKGNIHSTCICDCERGF